MKIRRKKRAIILAVLAVLLLGAGYFLYPIVRYSVHNYQEFQRIPDELSLDIPFSYDGHFSVRCTIGGKEVDMGISTSGICLMKEEDLKKYHAIYFGRAPLPTRNVRGQWDWLRLYRIPDFRIDTFAMNPLFASVGKHNYMHLLVGDSVFEDNIFQRSKRIFSVKEGQMHVVIALDEAETDIRRDNLMGNGVLGFNIMQQCIWLFSVDEGRVRIFSVANDKRLEQESKGFHKIQDGLEKEGISARLGSLKEDLVFSLAIGVDAEVIVNNEVSAQLKKRYPYKVILTLRGDNSIDSLFVFDGVPVVWDGITIPNCQIAHKSKFAVNKNFFGSQLMHRFNFILNYSGEEGDPLYIQPRKGFEAERAMPILSALGLQIEARAQGFVVSRLELGGIAEKAGIALGDVVLELDGRAPRALLTSQDFIRYTADKKEIRLRIKGKGEMRLAL
ncbi:hypothetical protein N425_13485 [Tannerella sp. oral taxon BU063 isolate Cell 2]|uniref:PDZ domain-containing protein n=1 Tax=Tannerella sp. oral taxon BU063 isolate Cell 2 TaxID=1411148 RepID=W2C0Y0_9BACT|nr:hypothetical protein N425_13485 [Tannerella sp. oral taxon BU063 isolate Cell 2]